MQGTVRLKWVQQPRQDRSWRTLERICEAAESLLSERGFEAVSVAEIAHTAGVSVGTIYARFRDKAGLLNFLHEQFCEEAMATADEALEPARWEGAGAAEIVAALIGFSIEVYSRKGGMLRAFLFHGCTDPDFQARGRRLGEYFVARLQALLLSRREEIGHSDPAFAAVFGMGLVFAMLRDAFVLGEGLPGTRGLGLDVLERELTRAYGAYLGLREGRRGDDDAWAGRRRVG